MNEINKRENEKYFAAANTYEGFKSYFAHVFKVEEYERIFVIKGGPGTGKSSFMRKIVSAFENTECKIEEIYCSSDPSSLDGIILSIGEKKIAFLDGTAPHETDARLPGAKDEIINLGDNWDISWLKAKSAEIIDLAKEKSRAYSTAYSYLKIAGTAFDFSLKCIKGSFDFLKAKSAIIKYCQELSFVFEDSRQIRLVSSFGKRGKMKLDTLNTLAATSFSISGDEILAFILLGEIKKHLDSIGASYVCFPNSLSSQHLDAIYIPSASVVFATGEGPNPINAQSFVKESYKLATEQTKCAKGIQDIALQEAMRWFGIASDFHFRLEEIYSQAMFFEKNNGIYEKKLKEVMNILEL